MSDAYQEKLDRHSHARRIDPLRDAAHRAVMAWMAEDSLEKNDLSEQFWDAMADLAAVLVERKRGEPYVPEVEVTESSLRNAYGDVGQPVPTSQGSSSLVAASENPLNRRRSPAKNRSEPRYQKAFIEEARANMGHPSREQVEALIGHYVKLTFNVDWQPAKGVLTHVKDQHGGSPYLLLDDYRERAYPLYTIERIEELPHQPGDHPALQP